MRVWIVIEEDRGMGTTVVGVFDNLEAAQELASLSSHYCVDSQRGHIVDGDV